MPLVLSSIDLPAPAVAAVGDSLVLVETEPDGRTGRLVHFRDGAMTDTITEHNIFDLVTYASDDRWLVWTEAADEDGDPWSIWAWDSSSGTVSKIVAADSGLETRFLNPQFRLKMSHGKLLWASFDMTPSGPLHRLHLLDLASGDNMVIATGDSANPFFRGYDICQRRIAYQLGQEIFLMVDGVQQIALPAVSPAEVTVTDEAVLWNQGKNQLYMFDGSETKELPRSSGTRWFFTGNEHYASWAEQDANGVHLLRTSDGEEFVISGTTGQGGIVTGGFIIWQRKAAKLPAP